MQAAAEPARARSVERRVQTVRALDVVHAALLVPVRVFCVCLARHEHRVNARSNAPPNRELALELVRAMSNVRPPRASASPPGAPPSEPESVVSPEPRRRKRALALDVFLALVLAPAVVYAVLHECSGTRGVVDVADDEVAVALDAWNGTHTISNVPGYRAFVPWFQDVYTLDRSPRELVFTGAKYADDNHVPQLEVRARDGSRFWFEHFSLSYALIADQAARVIEDSGPGDRFEKFLVRTYARSILRDELGRLAPEEAMKPDVTRTATTRAMERLAVALAPHGIEVLEISTPKPSFDKEYEQLIDRRKQGDLEIEKKRTYRAQLPREREDRLRDIRMDKKRELDELRRNLAVELAAAERTDERMRAEVDIFHAARLRAGAAARAELAVRAATAREKNTGRIEDRRRELENLARDGDNVVRAALIDRLANVTFRFEPFARETQAQSGLQASAERSRP